MGIPPAVSELQQAVATQLLEGASYSSLTTHLLFQGSAKGIPAALSQLRRAVATQLQPPPGFQQELASQAEEGGLIGSGDWNDGSDKWTQAWSAICQV